VQPEVLVALDASARLAGAAIFLYSAGLKLVAPSGIRQTITALRLPAPIVLAATLSICELGTAVLLAAAPRSWLTSALVVVLGLSFAASALLARLRGQSVRCACLGRSSGAELGWRQFALLPVWFALAWLAHSATSDRFVGLPWLAVTALSLSLLIVVFRLLPLGLKSWSYLKVLENQWVSSGSSSRS
jgi:hypothetical protein